MGKKSAKLGAASAAIDPTLDALFSTSSGPVKAPPKSRYSQVVEKTSNDQEAGESEIPGDEDEAAADDDEELSEASQELDYENEEDNDTSSEASDSSEDADGKAEEHAEATNGDLDQFVASKEASKPPRERKRKRKDENEDLEDTYMAKLANEDEPQRSEKRQKAEAAESEEDDEKIPQHESLTKANKSTELEKADRTVFLANVPSEAVSRKSAKRTLLAHLSSVLDQDAGEKVESIRFRSVAFSTGSMPKRAAYITKQLMDSTTKSANAYVVFSSAQGARKAANKLNGTEILGRHLRVDSVSHPSPTDHRRCVFVGNLGFVDDESILDTTEEGETVKKKRSKTPADIEEGLWRTFGKKGKVESVRVVRDPKTRVGKGFAYVQFYDGNSVEAALLLDGKKFPPMLPRILRVTRAKDPRKTASAIEREKTRLNIAKADGKATKYKPKLTAEEKSMAGRAGKLLGRAGAAAERRKASGKDAPNGKSVLKADDDVEMKTPEQIVFEGARATNNGRPKDLKLGKKGSKGAKGNKGKPQSRGTRRAAEWRKKKA